MNDRKHWKDQIFYTDYPLTRDEHGVWIQGVVRRVKILSYDGDKYASVWCLDDPLGEHEFKIGYIYHDPDLTKYIKWRLRRKMAGDHPATIKGRYRKTKFHIWVSESPTGFDPETVTVETIKEFNALARRWTGYGHSIVGAVDIVNRNAGSYYSIYDPRWEAVPTFGTVRTYMKRTNKPGPFIRKFVRA